MAKVNNKDVLQSYILTTAKYDFSVYEKRILYRIVELLQKHTEGKKLNEKYNINLDLYGDTIIRMPTNAFLKEDDSTNYKEVKKAFLSLRNKVVEYEDERIWKPIGIIESPTLEKYNSVVEFRLDKKIYDVFLDFSKGYKKYELKTAMQFESIYAMRFYELLSGQKEPITYTIERLKEIFAITGKYQKVNHFKERIIDTAKKELDKCSPYTFDYKFNKQGRSFYSITFFPKHQPQFRDEELEKHDLQKQISLSWDLPKNVVDYLKHNFEFTTDGIKNNLELFKQAHEEIDIISFLASLKGKIRASNNPQGYIIGSLKKQLNN